MVNIGVLAKSSAASLGLVNAKKNLALSKAAESKHWVKIQKLKEEEKAMELKMKTVWNCEEFVKSHPKWTKKKVLGLFPEFHKVIDLVMDDNNTEEEA